MANEWGNDWIPGTLTLSDLTNGTVQASIQSGTNVVVHDGNNYEATTDSQHIQYGVDLQHHNWKPYRQSDPITEYKLSHTFTHDVLEKTEDVAKFEEIVSVNISTESPIQIEINDPWWLDPATNTQPGNAYNPINGQYQVFLNQTIQGGVYYSLRAQDTYTANGITLYFENWSGRKK